MARPGIMLYFDVREPLSALSDAERGRLFTAILEYGETGVAPEFQGMLALAWSFIRPMIDKDGQRYDDMKLQREYAIFCKKRKRILMPKILFEDWVVMSEVERQRAVDPVASRNNEQERAVITDNEQKRAVVTDNEQKRAVVTDNEQKRAVSSLYPTTVATTTNNDNEQCTTDNVQLQPSVSNNNLQQHGAEARPNAAATATEDEGKSVKCVGGTLGKGVVFLSDDQVGDLLERMELDVFNHYVDKLSNFIIQNNARVKNHYETILKWWREDSAVRGGVP